MTVDELIAAAHPICVAFIQRPRIEGCKLQAYLCPAGVWTIGWGETDGVVKGMRWSQDRADRVLRMRVESFMRQVLAVCPAARTLKPHQLAAITSLAYNIGIENFKTSTVAKRITAGNLPGAADAILWWNQSKGRVLEGLVYRRDLERTLFLTGV